MFGKQKQELQEQQAAKPKVKLTLAEKREIRKIMEAARGDGKAHSAQDTLPFRQMYPDGLCKLDENTWSKCIEFEDVNYQLAKPDDQTAIFEALCDMYNAHDASIGMELSLVSRRMNREDFVKRIEIAAQGDNFDHIRELYTQMLRKQLEKGNNGLVKTKYLTLTIEAKDIRTARARFSRIILDALNHFKVMGALAKELNGKEWLEVLHGILHPDGERFSFEWGWLAPSGLHVKDFISPSSFRFGEARRFRMADKFCAVSFLQISAPEMDDRLLTELLDTDSGLLVSLHIRSMDQNEAIKTVKRKITDIDSMKIDAQKRAVREGFDMDIIPTDIATYAGEAKNILRDLQSRNERMFLMTFLVVNFADSKQKLDNDLLRAASVAQKYNCSLVRLDFQQEDGFVSSLPLGVNRIKIQRGLTTSSVAVFVPFTTQEIFHGGEALYYGLNATSGNMILADRKKLKTPNGMILGTPGSGKSFSAKRSILGVFLNTKDDILICDPEAEYFPPGQPSGGPGHQDFTYQQTSCEPYGYQPQLQRGRQPSGAQIRFHPVLLRACGWRKEWAGADGKDPDRPRRPYCVPSVYGRPPTREYADPGESVRRDQAAAGAGGTANRRRPGTVCAWQPQCVQLPYQRGYQ